MAIKGRECRKSLSWLTWKGSLFAWPSVSNESSATSIRCHFDLSLLTFVNSAIKASIHGKHRCGDVEASKLLCTHHFALSDKRNSREIIFLSETSCAPQVLHRGQGRMSCWIDRAIWEREKKEVGQNGVENKNNGYKGKINTVSMFLWGRREQSGCDWGVWTLGESPSVSSSLN